MNLCVLYIYSMKMSGKRVYVNESKERVSELVNEDEFCHSLNRWSH